MKKYLPALAAILITTGCATSMKMPPPEISQLQDNEGVVIGSVLVQGREEEAGEKLLCTLFAKKYDAKEPAPADQSREEMELGEIEVEDSLLDLYSPSGKEYRLRMKRVGEEETFVTKLPAGQYFFIRIAPHSYLHLPFTVRPQKTVYIGRLTIEFIGEIAPFRTCLTGVTDDKANTIAALREDYPGLPDNVETDLMGVHSGREIEIPVTFSRAWYRDELKNPFAPHETGKLTINYDALEFTGENREVTIPFSEMLAVTYVILANWQWAIIAYGNESSPAHALLSESGGAIDIIAAVMHVLKQNNYDFVKTYLPLKLRETSSPGPEPEEQKPEP